MRLRTVAVLSAAVVALSGCGGGADEVPVGEGPGGAGTKEAGPVQPGESFTYPDGLVVSVGNWREETDRDYDPSTTMALDITASNPTGEVIETTQAWVSVRAGDAGERLTEWALGDSLDAVLQPGAEATATYNYDVPETDGHVTATVSWLEATDPAARPEVEFIVEE